jgi:hypothetical protein
MSGRLAAARVRLLEYRPHQVPSDGREPVAHPVSHRSEDHLRLMALKIQLTAVQGTQMFADSFYRAVRRAGWLWSCGA